MKNQLSNSLSRELSALDQQILSSYFNLADSLVALFGEHCEVVIHQLTELSSSVVKIVNGFHTGRTVGSPITDKALQILKQYEQQPDSNEKSYFSTAPNGNLIKSTTHIIFGEQQRPIGLLCINLNLSYPFNKIIESLSPPREETQPLNNEFFSNDIHQLIEQAFDKACLDIDKYQQVSNKNRKKEIVARLYEQGIFELKESVLLVAEKLEITPHTIYKHLRSLKN